MKLQDLNKRVLLVILDGFGINPNTNKNAIRDAKKPNIDKLFANYPFTTILAGGEEVGLPSGVAGNSEVGHMNLGAGKPVRQDLVRINEAIENKTLKNMPKLQELIEKAQSGSKRIHLMGLLSDGGVHSHIEHLKELYKVLIQYPELKLFFHAFTDGRDTARDSGINFVNEVLKMDKLNFASMQGRSIGMDRDRRWEKIELAFKTMTGQAAKTNLKPAEYLQDQYKKKLFDEFVEPVLFNDDAAINKDDCIFFINYRPDRAIQITLAFADPKFTEFKKSFNANYFLCMTPYVEEWVELPILFDKEKVHGGLCENLSKLNIKQYKIAETEKFAHITYFFNGGEREPFPGEDRVLIPSPREVKTYDEKPQMSAPVVLENLTAALKNKSYQFYLVNFANSDMVGHTGNYNAAVEAIETLDSCVGSLMQTCEQENITMLLTADHGNSDQMVYDDGSPHTSHTGAPVPFAVFDKRLKSDSLIKSKKVHALCDVAPTVMSCMGLNIPDNFQGKAIYE
jgi:2,3-bisphosphoglycerate-independent phosphoglycerate mutase